MVFGEPPGGWSAASTPAVITASDGHQLSAIAVSDTIAVAVDGPLSNASPVTAYLFERPAGGWSGNLHEVATLVASGASLYGPAALTPAAIVGRTAFTADGSTVYAFAEPADGWSGTVHPSARLRVGGPRDATSAIAASGRNVIASTPNNAIRVFTEPARGWTRTVQPTTTLHPPRHGLFGFSGAVAISQRTIVAASSLSANGQFIGAYVFDEPRGGWRRRRVTARTVKTVAPTYLSPWSRRRRVRKSYCRLGRGAWPRPREAMSVRVRDLHRSQSHQQSIGGHHAEHGVRTADHPPSPWIAISGRTLGASTADGIQTYAISSSR